MSPEPAAVRRVLDAFLDELAGRKSARDLAAFLDGRPDARAAAGHGSEPLPAIESALVRPLLEAVGLTVERRPFGGPAADWPDFALAGLDAAVVGECVPPTDDERTADDDPATAAEAASEAVAGHLDRRSIDAEYGVATDGLAWVVLAADRAGDVPAHPTVGDADLRPALRSLARERGLVAGPDRADGEGTTAEEAIAGFADLFSRDAFETLLTRTAPRRLRESRRREVGAFSDRYVGLLFGAGEAAPDRGCLLDGVRPPPDASRRDERVFCLTLATRLAFVGLLADRGVLPAGLLCERLRQYDEGDWGGSLYETRIAPLLYDELATPPDRPDRPDRSPDDRPGDGRPTAPPLGPGLFRDPGFDERRFDVADGALRRVVDAVLAWRGADGDLDPAVLGSAFERTIDHLDPGRGQKAVGAYYTPPDVVDLVVRETVEPRVRDALVESFGPADAGNGVDGMDLAAVLRAVETGEGRFGDREAVRAAYDRLGDLTVLDPSCGSGHFLTTALDALHRARLSLLRALADGAEPGPRERYRSRADLARGCIHGVDVNPVAVEIATMRLWLWVAADAGRGRDRGPLPAIDANLAVGNALVGLPATGTEGDAAGVPPEGVEDRPTPDERYLASFDSPVEVAMDPEALDALAGTGDDGECAPEEGARPGRSPGLAPTVSSVRARRADGAAITDDGAARLADLGFAVHTKSARLDLAAGSGSPDRGQPGPDGLVDGLRDLLADGFELAVDRLPTARDLARVPGGSLHWPGTFPAVGEDRDAVPAFDVVLGNPPYGDLLDATESRFVSAYETSGVGDASANFVERGLDLLAPGGRFGNVTTLRLVYQRSLDPLHDLLRERLAETRIACFGFRPSRLFPDAHVNTAVVTGRKPADPAAEGDGVIRTSDFVLFTDETRREALSSVEYGDTRGLVLGDEIGDPGGTGTILPKVGPDVKRSVLTTLREYDGPPLGERFTRSEPAGDPAGRGGDSRAVYRTRGVLYWLNPMLEPLYDGSEVEPMYFETARERDAAFVVMQSSLYYVYWLAYSDLHHHNWSHVRPFPFPTRDALDRHGDRFEALATRLWAGMKAGFTRSRETRGDFHVRPLKPVVDEVDGLLAEVYGLSAAELEFVTGYLTDLGADSGRRAVDGDGG